MKIKIKQQLMALQVPVIKCRMWILDDVPDVVIQLNKCVCNGQNMIHTHIHKYNMYVGGSFLTNLSVPTICDQLNSHFVTCDIIRELLLECV